MDFTPEDAARWPDETKVLVDMALERPRGVKVWSEKAIQRAMRRHNGSVKPYRTEMPGWVFDGEYEMWRGGGAAPAPITRLTEANMLSRLHQDCPLSGCQDFDMRQRSIPVSNPPIVLRNGSTIVTSQPATGDSVWINGVRLTATAQGRWDILGMLQAQNLLPPETIISAVDHETRSITITAAPRPRGSVQLLTEDQRTSVATLTNGRAKLRRERAQLQAARAPRRLDGRRA